MSIVLIVLKIGIVISYVSIVKMIVDFKKTEPEARLQLDLLSRLEVAAVAGISLAGLLSVIDEKTYVFTCAVCFLGIVLSALERYRLIFAGKSKVLLCGKQYSLKNIQKLGTGMFTLKVYLKGKNMPLSIYVPLSSNEVLRQKISDKIK